MQTLPTLRSPTPVGPSRLSVTVQSVAGVVLALVFLLLAFHRPLLHRAIEQRARARGVSLTFDDFDWSRDHVVLKNTRAWLTGEHTIVVEAREARVDLDDLEPRRITSSSLTLSLIGAPADVVASASRFRHAHEHEPPLDLSLTSFTVAVHDSAAVGPWLKLVQSRLESSGGKGRLTTGGEQVGAHTLPGVDVRFVQHGSTLQLGLGDVEPSQAPLRATIIGTDVGHQARIEAERIALGATLGPLLPRTSPIKNGVLDGSVDLLIPNQGAQTGSFSISLKGLALPIPAEARSLISTSQVQLNGKLSHEQSSAKVQLSSLEARSGQLVLKGKGEAHNPGSFVTLQAHLDGALPCSALAGNAIDAQLGGGIVGGVLGAMAKAAVSGTVSIAVDVEADSRAPSSAQIRPTVRPNCGL